MNSEVTAMRKVLEAFHNHLANITYAEYLFSRLQNAYIRLQWDDDYLESTEIIRSAEELCSFLLDDIYADVFLDMGLNKVVNPYSSPKMAECRIEAKKRMIPYMENLPEYQYLIDEVVNQDSIDD